MKAIIFDLDDTLIDWKEDYLHIIHKYMNDHGYNVSYETVKKISQLVDNHEVESKVLSKESLLNYINSNCDINLDMNYMNDFLKSFKDCSYEDKDTLEVIDYLSKKYDLYVITNWFTEAQKLRLETMGILKYFKNVIGADINYLKPNEKVYDILLKDYSPNECISIGDNYQKDIEIPLKLGMNVIWKTNKKDELIKTIRKISELKEIL